MLQRAVRNEKPAAFPILPLVDIFPLPWMQALELGWEVKPFRAPSIVGRVGKRLQGLSAGSAAAMASASSLKILRELQSRPENKVWRAAQRASIQR